MARNVQLNLLRGLFAHMPTLNIGELYFCTDTFELYVGTSSGNKRVGELNNVKVGTGSVAAQSPSTVSGGPANPRKPVAFTQVIIGGTTYWLPLFQ